MSRKGVIFGIAGVFVMLSFFVLMIGAQLFLDSVLYYPQLIVGLISAGIGFYLLGYGLDLE